jgi:hypothetical protein
MDTLIVKLNLRQALAAVAVAVAMLAVSVVVPAQAASGQVGAIDAGGTVRSSGGGPVSGVKVNLFTEGRAVFLGPAVTDRNGRYSFELPGPACYVVTFIAPSGAVFVDTNGRFKNTSFCATTQQAVTGLDATLTLSQQTAELGGVVTDESSTPVAGVRAVIYAAEGEGRGRWLGRAFTGSDGTWRFAAGSGCYVVDLVAPEGRNWVGGGRYRQVSGCIAGADNLGLGGTLAGGSSSAANIVLGRTVTVEYAGFTWRLDFYRNLTHRCGLSGNYTFLVINPVDDADGSAPMWVYLHGGGAGYFDDNGRYWATIGQDENGWNREEGFNALWDYQVRQAVLDGADVLIDQTLKRRLEQGYRIVVPSMCDHDLYSGQGTAYPNNPNAGRQVNGLQATKAAVEYVFENYPSTDVFAHGISAGSVGAFSLAQAFVADGRPLTGVVADSYIVTPRMFPLFDALGGRRGFPFAAGFDPAQVVAKVGAAIDPSRGADPEARIRAGFRATPVLFIGAEFDAYCGGNQAPIAPAAAAGLANCQWFYEGLRQAIAAQPSSPHQLVMIERADHVPTDREGPVNDIVDDFIRSAAGRG